MRKEHRGRGLSGTLTQIAMSLATEQGARVLEACPLETDGREDPMSIYTGVASTFQRLGFEGVQRKAPHKPMMRLELTNR